MLRLVDEVSMVFKEPIYNTNGTCSAGVPRVLRVRRLPRVPRLPSVPRGLRNFAYYAHLAYMGCHGVDALHVY